MKVTQKYQAQFIHTILPVARLRRVRRIGKRWMLAPEVPLDIQRFLGVNRDGKAGTNEYSDWRSEHTWEELISYGMRPNGLLDFTIGVEERDLPLSNRDRKRIQNSIRKLVGRDHDNLWSFYRSCYKYTDCGPTIGFLVDDEWVYGSELPDTPLDDILPRVTGISVSSIVEGSDVEVEPRQFTKSFKPAEFWSALEDVNNEASFYWERDNSRWFYISDGPHCANFHETWGEWVWDEDEGDEVPDADKRALEHALLAADGAWGKDVAHTVGDYTVLEYINDGTY